MGCSCAVEHTTYHYTLVAERLYSKVGLITGTFVQVLLRYVVNISRC